MRVLLLIRSGFDYRSIASRIVSSCSFARGVSEKTRGKEEEDLVDGKKGNRKERGGRREGRTDVNLPSLVRDRFRLIVVHRITTTMKMNLSRRLFVPRDCTSYSTSVSRFITNGARKRRRRRRKRGGRGEKESGGEERKTD